MSDKSDLLDSQVRELEQTVAGLKGTLEQLNRTVTASNRMTVWQFIVFAVVMLGTMLFTMYWASNVLEY